MLTELEIRGLGVIDSALLPLSPGFTAITGETGAGKTMVVTALGLLLGGRGSAQLVRQGADRARVEGRVLIAADGEIAAQVDEAGGELDTVTGPDGVQPEAELVLARQLLESGRSRAWLGGQSVPAGKLGEIGAQLVAVHGQSEQLRLAQEPVQRAVLDAFGGDELLGVRDAVAEIFDRLQQVRGELDALRDAAEARVSERERLQLLIDEVEQLDPQPDEDRQLLARIERLANREELRALMGEAHELLAGEEHPGGSVRELSRTITARIERAHRSDGSLDTTVEAANDLVFAAEDLATRLAGYLADLDVEGIGELDSLNERLAAIESLKTRYRIGLDELLDQYAAAGARLLELAGDDQRIPQLAAQVQELESDLVAAADRLSGLRQKAGDELAARVTEELHALAMPNAELSVSITTDDEIRRLGQDRVALLLAPHPGAAPAPLATSASGGELSRVMLGLEVVLSAANPVSTLVFDEIDAGVGGAAALEIGARLQRLAATRQVIVVTHLAQVAAFADQHLHIEKTTDGQVTTSSIRALDEEARVNEMTRLLSGLPESESGREHAKELLRRAAATGRDVG